MRGISILAVVLSMSLFAGCIPSRVEEESEEDAQLDAETLLEDVLASAQRENKDVLVYLSAPWCGWCHIFGEFLQANKELFADDYVVLKIDVEVMKNGPAVAERLLDGRNGGIPWMVILDADGNELISSDGPDGNIGCPIGQPEREYFLEMIRQTNKTMSEERIATIAKALEENAAKYE